MVTHVNRYMTAIAEGRIRQVKKFEASVKKIHCNRLNQIVSFFGRPLSRVGHTVIVLFT